MVKDGDNAILPDLPSRSYPSGEYSPERLAEAEADAQQTLIEGYQAALVGRGVSEDRLARLRVQELGAVKVQLVKIKGHLPKQLKLPRGYKVITPTERIAITDPETGAELVVDPGETLIEFRAPDWSTRERAIQAIEAIMGYRSEQEVGGDGRTVIVVNSLVPLPEPPPSPEALALVHGTDPESSSSSGAGGGNGNGGGP
jgi:hypothetical protein